MPWLENSLCKGEIKTVSFIVLDQLVTINEIGLDQRRTQQTQNRQTPGL